MLSYQDTFEVFKVHLFLLLNYGGHYLFFPLENPLILLPVTAP